MSVWADMHTLLYTCMCVKQTPRYKRMLKCRSHALSKDRKNSRFKDRKNSRFKDNKNSCPPQVQGGRCIPWCIRPRFVQLLHHTGSSNRWKCSTPQNRSGGIAAACELTSRLSAQTGRHSTLVGYAGNRLCGKHSHRTSFIRSQAMIAGSFLYRTPVRVFCRNNSTRLRKVCCCDRANQHCTRIWSWFRFRCD